MKKTLLFLAAISMAVAANAKILRVSNVSGSSAPYASIEAAHDAASAGDTIMVDGSSTRYTSTSTGNIDLTKKVVVIGPGYWLTQNGIIEEGGSSAVVGRFTVKAEGTVIKGMTLNNLAISAPHVVINRCYLGDFTINKNADNAVISQCFIAGTPVGNHSCFHQITNNIFTFSTTGTLNVLSYFDQSTIAYNTFRSAKVIINVTNCTIEHNLWIGVNDKGSNNSINNNYETNIISTQATNDFIDSDYYKLEIPEDVISKYGAFAGDSPYIMSGVPSGPIITDLVVPTTVETGSKMNVTIKVEMIK